MARVIRPQPSFWSETTQSQDHYHLPDNSSTVFGSCSTKNGLGLKQAGRSTTSLASQAPTIPLPPKTAGKFWRNVRHTGLNVYRRLFSFMLLINLVIIGLMVRRNWQTMFEPSSLAELANISSANILLAVLIRQDYVVNLLFRIAWSVPLSAPLRIRRFMAKVYEHGGIHSGAAISATLLFCLFTGCLTKKCIGDAGKVHHLGLLVTTYGIITVLFALVITAYPRFRFFSHNTFEIVHRWGGWFAMGLFWAELVLFLEAYGGDKPIIRGLVELPATCMLLVASFHSVLPWLRLHRLRVLPEKLSEHAIRLHFTEKIPLFVGIRISDSPFKEWHSFACIPCADPSEGPGGSVLISNAGDWTKKTIEHPQEYYWIKGVPVTGVLSMARIFRKCIIVTTGSGIGPVLAVAQDIPAMGTKVRITWSAQCPLTTFGWEICRTVERVDPNAVVIDTRRERRPNLTQLAFDLYMEEEAECVFVISNPKLTKKIVYGLELRGVPAFGPVFDS